MFFFSRPIIKVVELDAYRLEEGPEEDSSIATRIIATLRNYGNVDGEIIVEFYVKLQGNRYSEEKTLFVAAQSDLTATADLPGAETEYFYGVHIEYFPRD